MIDLPGEVEFFESIKDKCNTIFDVGCIYSEYIKCDQVVHYFDVSTESIDNLKLQPNSNSKSYFNYFGLSDNEEVVDHYDTGAIFIRPGFNNNIMHQGKVKRADNYITENQIQKIDFLKIDVEGYELKVLQGFGDKIELVNYIQFEYGTGLRDAGYTLAQLVSYLESYGFGDFGIINSTGGVDIFTDYTDHWTWCNMACKNRRYA
jgi:FkbM family methyltransferase